MQIITSGPASSPAPCVAAIGFFDGVHAGHRYLIRQVIERAGELGLRSAVVTFPVHPRQVMQSDFHPELLTTLEEKQSLLADTGLDYCLMPDFTPALSRLTAQDFMKDVLYQHYQVRGLVIGYDHRFGHNRSETFDDYSRYGKEIGMNVFRAQAFDIDHLHISSSNIRNYLRGGEVSVAARCLGYDYFLQGHVVTGHRIGHTIGFPTANLQTDDPDKLIPADGVYAVHVEIGAETYPGMLNIGHRPTVNNGSNRSIEAHILNFSGDIYGQDMRISFVRRIRSEQKFNNLETLVAQLQQDRQTVSKIFAL